MPGWSAGGSPHPRARTCRNCIFRLFVGNSGWTQSQSLWARCCSTNALCFAFLSSFALFHLVSFRRMDYCHLYLLLFLAPFLYNLWKIQAILLYLKILSGRNSFSFNLCIYNLIFDLFLCKIILIYLFFASY